MRVTKRDGWPFQAKEGKRRERWSQGLGLGASCVGAPFVGLWNALIPFLGTSGFAVDGDASGGGVGVESQPTRPVTTRGVVARRPTQMNLLPAVVKCISSPVIAGVLELARESEAFRLFRLRDNTTK